MFKANKMYALRLIKSLEAKIDPARPESDTLKRLKAIIESE